MKDDVSDIAALYNSDPESEHYRLEKHQLEYELTWRYLNQYLPFFIIIVNNLIQPTPNALIIR